MRGIFRPLCQSVDFPSLMSHSAPSVKQYDSQVSWIFTDFGIFTSAQSMKQYEAKFHDFFFFRFLASALQLNPWNNKTKFKKIRLCYLHFSGFDNKSTKSQTSTQKQQFQEVLSSLFPIQLYPWNDSAKFHETRQNLFMKGKCQDNLK